MGSRTCQRLGFVLGLGSVSILLLALYNSRHSTVHELLSNGYATTTAIFRTPASSHAPPRTQWDPNQRYLVYLPYEGISNQFYSFQNAATMAKRLNRTLVVPPITSNRHDRLGTHQPWSHFMDLEHMSTHSGIRLVEWHKLKLLDQESLRIAGLGNRTQISELWRSYAEPLPCQVIRGFGHEYFVQTEDDSIGADFAYKFLLNLEPIPVPGYQLQDSVAFVDDILSANMDSKEPAICFTFTFSAQFQQGKNRWDIGWAEAGQYARFLPRFASYVEDLIAYRFGILDDRFSGIMAPTDNNHNQTLVRRILGPSISVKGETEEGGRKRLHRRGETPKGGSRPGRLQDERQKQEQHHPQAHPHPPWDLGNSILDQGPEAETFLSRKAPLDDYIAIHLRRGDIELKCVNNATRTDCVVPVSEYKSKVDAILDMLHREGAYLKDHEEEEQDDTADASSQDLNNGDKDSDWAQPPISLKTKKKRLPKVVLVSDTKSAEEKKEIDSYGWYRLDHDLDPNLIDASKVLGPFSPALIDSAVLTGRGARWVIGSRRSTMSWLTAMRTASWFNRTIIYPRPARPPIPKNNKKKPKTKSSGNGKSNNNGNGNDINVDVSINHKSKNKSKFEKVKASSPSGREPPEGSEDENDKVELDRHGMYIMNGQDDSIVIWDRDEQSYFDNLTKSEYWKSNAKFYCRFCNIYITDNKSTRNIHDSGNKHKENVERFLRDQSQKGRQKEADTARMNKQMDAIEKAALKQYKLDVEAGLVTPTADMTAALEALEASETAATSSAKKPDSSAAKSTSAATLRATGSNSEPLPSDRVKKEESQEPPKPVRDETVGQAGAWETVEAPAPLVSSSSSSSRNTKKDQGGKIKSEDEGGNHIVPGADDDDDGVADSEDLRGFKIVEKTYPIDDDDDEGAATTTDGSGGSLFKKRKGGASKPKNIRRKL
ncbi:hypothetical protein BGZ83_006409 [Gryganskiella cystojenkinii]|nr:hypothetical protein BGZ83_006409 [Gryganskiella cystojenkinii]